MYCVKFKDVFPFIKNGANIKQDANAGGIPITRIETLAGGEFNTSRLGYANIFDASPYREYVLNSGDVLMSHINSPAYLGRAVVFEDKYDVVIHGMNLLRLKANKELINPRYAVYLFNGNTFKEDIRKITKKSVNQASFSINDLKEIKLQLPSIESQIVVAEKLDKLKLLIKKKNKLILFLDELIKSRFVELFGDVVLNTLNWPLVKLSAIAEYRIGLTYKPEAVSSSGIAVLRSGNIQNSQLCYEDTIYVNSKVEPKLLLKKNDILMCARNGSQSLVGKVALIENDISNTTYGAFMMAISSKYYVYLFEYFRSQAFRRLISVGSTTTINQVTTRMLNSIVIPLPDLDTINRFALYHSQINKLKSDVQKSIDETQLLMDSLMQEYFG